jgi:hypothetical protein
MKYVIENDYLTFIDKNGFEASWYLDSRCVSIECYEKEMRELVDRTGIEPKYFEQAVEIAWAYIQSLR